VPTDRRIAVAAAVVIAAVLFASAPGGHLGYDAEYQLVWARDLTDGHTPQYDVRLAPTPHPLQILAGIPAALLGQGGDEAMRLASLLAFGLLVVGLARLGTLLFSLWVGLLAAAVALTRPHLAEMAHLGDAALPAAALIVWAAVLELRRPPARVGAMALLAAAGLLRPEAWIAAGAYLLWAARGADRRTLALLAALAAAAPVLWILSDLAVTGDPLWSLHHTRDDTALLDRPTGLREGLEQLPRHLNFLLGPAVLAAGALGFGGGLLAARRRTAGLAVVMVLGGAGFLALAVAGLSLQPRYLAPLAAGVVLCAAVAALGWTAPGAGDRDRARWRLAGWAVLAVLVAGLPFDIAEHAAVRAELDDDGPLLEALARGPARRFLTECAPVAAPTIRPIPYLAFWTGTRPAAFTEAGGPAGAGATLVTPTLESESFMGGGGADQPQRVVVASAPGQHLVAQNRAWQVYSSC
jgi:hypothetical protein